MKYFKVFDFKVDSHIDGRLSATAGLNLDRVFGGKIDLGENDQFILSPGSIPSFCIWELGDRWGHCESSGRVTEFDGQSHVTL